MSIKDEIDKLVNEEITRLKDEAEKVAQDEKQWKEGKEQKFSPMRKVLEEICASVDSKYIRCHLALTRAFVEIGYEAEGLDYDNESLVTTWSEAWSRTSSIYSGWTATDIYEINRDDDLYPVDGKIVKRFSVTKRNDKSEYSDWGFLDESEVAQFLIARISKDIARLKHEGKP